MPWTPKDWTCDSRQAQELARWAEGIGVDLHARLYRAYWVDALDISDPAVLLAVAVDAGIDRAAAEAALLSRAGAPEVDADWARSRAVGVSAVPTYAAAGKGVVGAQPYETLVRLVRGAGAVPRT